MTIGSVKNLVGKIQDNSWCVEGNLNETLILQVNPEFIKFASEDGQTSFHVWTYSDIHVERRITKRVLSQFLKVLELLFEQPVSFEIYDNQIVVRHLEVV